VKIAGGNLQGNLPVQAALATVKLRACWKQVESLTLHHKKRHLSETGVFSNAEAKRDSNDKAQWALAA